MTGIRLPDRADGGALPAMFGLAGPCPADPPGRVAFSGAADIASLPHAESVVAGGLRLSTACAES